MSGNDDDSDYDHDRNDDDSDYDHDRNIEDSDYAHDRNDDDSYYVQDRIDYLDSSSDEDAYEIPRYNPEAARAETEKFHYDCIAISENRFRYPSFSPPRLRNKQAMRLGRALVGNTQLHELKVSVKSRLRMQGTQELVDGIQRSKIKMFTLGLFDSFERPSSAVMKSLCTEPLKTVSEMEFAFDLTDEDAQNMKEFSSFVLANESFEKLRFGVDSLSASGAQDLANVIRSSHIKWLEIQGDGEVLPRSSAVLSAIYSEGVRQSRVTRLSLDGVVGNMDALMTALPQLCTLTIQKVALSLDQVQTLSNGLSQPNQVEHLRLEQCKLRDNHMGILSVGLQHLHLKSLTLSSNKIGDAGVVSFIEHWNTDAAIVDLDFESNWIGSFGAQQLIQALSTRKLMTLSLARNARIGYDGLRMIGEELGNNTSLTDLFLDQVAKVVKYVKGADNELAKAQKEKVKHAAQALLDGVRRCMHLQDLTVEDVYLPHAITEEINFYLQLNYACGRKLILKQHLLPVSFWCFLLAKCKRDPSAIFYYLRELPVLMSGHSVSGMMAPRLHSSNQEPLQKKRKDIPQGRY